MPTVPYIIVQLRLRKLQLGLNRIWIPRVLSFPGVWFWKSIRMDLFLIHRHLTLCLYTCQAHKHLETIGIHLYPSDSQEEGVGWGLYRNYMGFCFRYYVFLHLKFLQCIINNLYHQKIKLLKSLKLRKKLLITATAKNLWRKSSTPECSEPFERTLVHRKWVSSRISTRILVGRIL